MDLSSALAAASTQQTNHSVPPPVQHHHQDGVTITWFIILGISVVLLGLIAMIRFRMRTVVVQRQRERIPSSTGTHLDRVLPVTQPVTLTARRQQDELLNSHDRPLMGEVWIQPSLFQHNIMFETKPVALERTPPHSVPSIHQLPTDQTLISVGILVEMPSERRQTAAPACRPLTLGVATVTTTRWPETSRWPETLPL